MAADPEVTSIDPLSAEDAAEEVLLGGLRLAEGVSRARMRRLGYDVRASGLAELRDAGLLDASAERIRLIGDGILLVDPIAASLVPLEAVGQEGA
jgi:coproporphyrinogen III oxidase-like Fe-S oxidoreductase